MTRLFPKLCIIGTGLIGASLALAAREKGLSHRITGCDLTQATVDKACELGIIDDGFTAPAEAVKGADLVAICTPLSAFTPIMQAIIPHLKFGAIVTDAGSTKRAIVEAYAKLPEGIYHFIPGHPIAGAEKSGPEAGVATLFKGKKWVITPDEDTPLQAIQKLVPFLEGIGAEVRMLTPENHDRIYAYVSHVAQFIVSSFMRMLISSQPFVRAPALEEPAFARFIRIGGSDPVMWRDIFHYNRSEVLQGIDTFLKNLHALETLAKEGDRHTLARTLGTAAHARSQLYCRHGERPLPQPSDDVMHQLLPLLIGTAYVQTVAEKEARTGLAFGGYAGSGFADVTTFVAMPPEAAAEALIQHSKSIGKAMAEYYHAVACFRMLTEHSDLPALAGALAETRHAYYALSEKREASAG